MEENKKTLIANIGETEVSEFTAAVEKYAEALEVSETEQPSEATENEKAAEAEESADVSEAAENEKTENEKTVDAEEPSEPEKLEEKEKEYGLPADHPEMGELRERIEKRKKEKKKKQRHFRTWVYVTAAVLMAIVFGFFFSISGFFTVDSIEVEGNDHYTSEEIINMAHAVPGRNLIYHTNKTEIIDYLEQNPYIKSADVVRKLPSTLLIVVNERTESMAFKYDDEYLVMDSEGILLRKSRSLPLTTLVEGMIVNKIKLGEVVGTEDKDKANKAIKLISSMTAADLYFVKVDMSNNKRVKAYIYDNLLVRADYDTMMTNINNGHLHKVVENLFEQGIKRGTITFDEDGSASFMPII